MSGIGVSFSSDGVELALPFDVRLPLATSSEDVARRLGEDRALWSALEEAWGEGAVEPVGPARVRVPFDRCLVLDSEILRALRLPLPEDVDVWVESSGVPTSAEFRVDVRVRHPLVGRLDPALRSGPAFVLSDQQCVLVREPVFRLIETAQRRPSTEAGLVDRLRYVADCRRAASAAGAKVDGFIEREEVGTCDRVEVDLAETAGGDLLLSPVAEDLSSSDLLLPNGRARSIVNQRTADGRVRRIIIPDDARAKIEDIGRRSRVSGADVPRLLTNPEALLPEGIDLGLFSKRVVGLRTRVYNSRPYVHVRERSRGWFEADWGVVAEPTVDPGTEPGAPAVSLPPAEYARLIEEAKATGERFVRFGDDWLEVDPEQGRKFEELTEQLSRARGPDGTLPRNVVLEVIPNVDDLGFEVTLPADVLEGSATLRLESLPARDLPRGLAASLHAHQLLGYRWLGYLHALGAGGLLADEMGVGKTLQIITHLLDLAERNELAPSLLVLPKTLIRNWCDELRRFAPSLRRILVYEGPDRLRDPGVLAGSEIVLTTYETLRRDQLLLATVDWKVVVCDEAQFVKNPTAGRTAAIKALKARQPIALTGTPVENGLIEFWCIVDYVQPGRLRSWSEFRTEFERPLASATEDERRPLVQELLRRLDPHYLRRMKDEVLRDLPPKEMAALSKSEPSSLQKRLYAETITQARSEGKGAMLAAIGRLLRICAHPRCEFGERENVPVTTLLDECPKLAETIAVLQSIRASDEKVLVFAEWKTAQRILQRVIAETLGFWPPVVNGEVTGNRLAIVEAFCARPGFGVMILSPHVAGYGLNIVAANHVIHYTRPWNPAKENQATDRVHRIGQTRPVRLYYPTVAGTAEERLAELLEEKQALARDVLRPSSERSVSPEELLAALDDDLGSAHGTEAT